MYSRVLVGAMLIMLNVQIFGQAKKSTLEYYRDIQPIIERNCVSCHYIGGVGPFSLAQIEDVVKRGTLIKQVTTSKYMPPWKADVTFSQHKNARVLSIEEIQKISAWVDGGMKAGKPSKQTKKPLDLVKTNTGKSQELTAIMQQSHTIEGNGKDDFRFFYVPTNTKEEAYVTSIHFKPGNKKRVHHSRVMIDTSGKIAEINGLSETDPKIYKFQQTPLADEFLYGWVPGNFVFKFPKGFGKRLPKGSNVLLNMHYAPTSKIETDQSSVSLGLVPKSQITREVKTLVLREVHISNQPFEIQAGAKPTFYMSSGALKKSISLLTVQPHAHLIGKSFRAFAITPEGDMIPLIKIDNWDFNWQTTYEFPNLVHIPEGSVILMEGSYDNSSENPANPNKPAKDVGYGWRTVDEMMNLIMYYVDYKPGDENLKLEY